MSTSGEKCRMYRLHEVIRSLYWQHSIPVHRLWIKKLDLSQGGSALTELF